MLLPSKIISLIRFSIIIITILSCSRNVVFEKNVKIKNHKWKNNDTIELITSITDTSEYHDILINIRNGGKYEYSNLFVFITVEAPNGSNIKDTLEIILADETGRWYGTGLGDIKSLSTIYKRNIKFSVPGIHIFKIVQGMRNNELQQVFDVGLRIQKSDLYRKNSTLLKI